MTHTAIIFGSGISGLSCAHELAEKGWSVTVYEKLSQPGGVARSKRMDSGIPAEYSWRGFGPWYHNVFELMRKIPTEKGQTVYNNLSRPIEFYFPHNDDTSFKKISYSDKVILLYELLRNAVADDRIQQYSTINASDYLSPKLSPDGWRQVTSAFGPWVGIDPQRASLHHVMSFMVKNIIPGSPAPHNLKDEDGEWSVGSASGWMVMKGPINDCWFDPWVEHLKTLGVVFHFNHSLEKLDFEGDTIKSAIVRTGDISKKIQADYYVCSISPFGAEKVFRQSQIPTSYKELIQDGPHVQISFRIAFDKEVKWPGQRRAIILTNSEFNLTLYRQDDLWEDNVHLGDGIKSLWSGTACISYKPGELFNKPMENLTKDEFRQEILHQLSKEKEFNQMLISSNGVGMKGLPIVYFEVWYSWEFSSKGIDNDEPKYVDSTNTRVHQPVTKTQFVNLMMSGAHTRTSADLWSMEAASESGRRAANLIANSKVINRHTHSLINALAYTDNYFYSNDLPNIIDVIFVLLFILIFVWIYLKVFRIKMNR